MYSKPFYQLVKKIVDFLTMANTNVATNTDLSLYAFKPFQYEELKPRAHSKVPYPRSGHRIGADSANFYSIGGYNPLYNREQTEDDDEFLLQSYPLFQELWKFNFARKEWRKFANTRTLPLELASNAVILHKHVLMVYGGTGSPFGFRCSNQLFVCRVNDKDGLMREVETRGQMPLAAYGQALVYHNDYLYTIGGTTGLLYTCDIHRLYLKTLTWESVYIGRGAFEYEPQGRYRHEVGFDGKNIYILGGGTALEAYGFSDIPTFNLKTSKWHPQKTLRDQAKGVPAARRCHGAVQISNDLGQQVFIVGGQDGDTVFDDLWRLDLQTFQWTCFDRCRLPIATYFHGAAVSPEGRLFIFGGICSSEDIINVSRSKRVYSTWLGIPKLSELCWEAVLHYSPRIVDCDSDRLVDLGLPRHYVQRLTK